MQNLNKNSGQNHTISSALGKGFFLYFQNEKFINFHKVFFLFYLK